MPFLENLLEDDNSDSDSEGEDECGPGNGRSKAKSKVRSLRALRVANIAAGAHDFAWAESVHNCTAEFSVGDFGYVPDARGKENGKRKKRNLFDNFVKLGNVYDSEWIGRTGGETERRMELVREVAGTHGQWVNGVYKRAEAYPMALPGEVEWCVFSFLQL